MKTENVVSDFRKECAETSARFASFPPQFLEFMGMQGYELVREELQKRRTPRRVMDLLDAALMMLIASEQTKAGKLDDITGMCVAETLGTMTQEMLALSADVWQV